MAIVIPLTWFGGAHSYLYLPKYWSGSCYFAYSMLTISTYPFYVPHFTAHCKRAACISQWEGILDILVPMTGTEKSDCTTRHNSVSFLPRAESP